MNLCTDCNKAPRMSRRRVCTTCRHKRVKATMKKSNATNQEYKIGAHGFVYLRVSDDWIKSSLTPREVRQMTGERLSA
jgi:hypothetical protein